MRTLPALLSGIIIVAAGVVLYRAFRGIGIADVAERFAAIPATSLWLAAAFTSLAMLSLAIYEVAMLRYIRSGLPDRWPFLTALEVGQEKGFMRVNPLTVPMIMPNATAGWLSMKLGVTGMATTVSQACSSGAAAIGDAARLVASGVVDRAIAGGTEALTHPVVGRVQADGSPSDCATIWPFSSIRWMKTR